VPIVPRISFFRLVAPPLQPRVVGPYLGMRCMVLQPFTTRGRLVAFRILGCNRRLTLSGVLDPDRLSLHTGPFVAGAREDS
jgi:hypothetical protein